MTRASTAAMLNKIFNDHRVCFTADPVNGVVRRRDCSEPDGGERDVEAYRITKEFYSPLLGANIPRGMWYPQDQAWDSFLSDCEFYAHYYVRWPTSLDTTERQRLLQARISEALAERAVKYIDALAARYALECSMNKVSELQNQYRQAFGSPDPEER